MNIITNTDKKIIHFIIRVWCLIGFVFFGHSLYKIIDQGWAPTKMGRAYIDSSPFQYWFSVQVNCVILIFLVWYFFKRPKIET